jgi:hypothetical protein
MKFADRTYDYDDKAPLSAGDLIALREMGADPERWVAMVDWVGADGKAQLTSEQYAQAAEALIQIAYLAGVRKDHDLRWRDFIWSLPLDDMSKWSVEVVEDEPVNRAERRAKAKKKATPAA